MPARKDMMSRSRTLQQVHLQTERDEGVGTEKVLLYCFEITSAGAISGASRAQTRREQNYTNPKELYPRSKT
jgi:hypothetical protein